MQVGRELDALVAEKVMKCLVKRTDGRAFCGCDQCDHSRDRDNEVDEYSTSIAAAWEIVEKLQSDGFDVDISLKPEWQAGCRVAPKGQFNTLSVHFESADTVPHAICLAALKAVGA